VEDVQTSELMSATNVLEATPTLLAVVRLVWTHLAGPQLMGTIVQARKLTAAVTLSTMAYLRLKRAANVGAGIGQPHPSHIMLRQWPCIPLRSMAFLFRVLQKSIPLTKTATCWSMG